MSVDLKSLCEEWLGPVELKTLVARILGTLTAENYDALTQELLGCTFPNLGTVCRQHPEALKDTVDTFFSAVANEEIDASLCARLCKDIATHWGWTASNRMRSLEAETPSFGSQFQRQIWDQCRGEYERVINLQKEFNLLPPAEKKTQEATVRHRCDTYMKFFGELQKHDLIEDCTLHIVCKRLIEINMFFDHDVRDVPPLSDFLRLCTAAGDVLRCEPNVVTLPVDIVRRVVVIGPTRGYYCDALSILRRTRSMWDVAVFLGDYSDGGGDSIRLWCYLLAWKIAHPGSVVLLRGRHETTRVVPRQTVSPACTLLREELLTSYGPEAAAAAYASLVENVFQTLPIAAVVHGKYLCVCGGLSPTLADLSKDLAHVDRSVADPKRGVLCDVLWGDPLDEEESGIYPSAMFMANLERGRSYTYSYNATVRFLQENNLLCVVRANGFVELRGERGDDVPTNSAGRPYHYQHSPYDPGFALHRKNPFTNFPTIVNLFSAPCYLDVNENKAAVLCIDGATSTFNIVQFDRCEQRMASAALPRGRNALTWSIPFLTDSIRDVLRCLRDVTNEDAPSEEPSEKTHFMRLCKKASPAALAEVMRQLPEMRLRRDPTRYLYDTSMFPRLQPLLDKWRELRSEGLAAWRTSARAMTRAGDGWWVYPTTVMAPVGCRAEFCVLLPNSAQLTHCCQDGPHLTLVVWLVTSACTLTMQDGHDVEEVEGQSVVIDTTFPHSVRNESPSAVRIALMVEFPLEAADDV